MTTEYPYGTTEKILAIIPNVTVQAGFMGVKSRQHSLIFTNNRILFARITVARMRELSSQAKADAAQENTGRLERLIANPHVYERLVELYEQLGPEGILADNEANFAVDRASIKAVKVTTTAGADTGVGSDVLIIKAAKKYKVTLGGSKAAARRALEAAGLA